MKAVDTNILVYAHREDSPFHSRARALLVELANGADRWAIPWPCIHEFLAITTHPRVYRSPTPLNLALSAMRQWIESHSCEVISEGAGYFDILSEMTITGQVNGPMIHDARIAAICRYNGITELLTCDRDFSRFGGLRTRNPLVER